MKRRNNRTNRSIARAIWQSGLECLESRQLLAATITIVPGASGIGSLDGNLLADGQVLFADADAGGNTLSTGALEAIATTTNIVVQATGSIQFNDLGGTLTLQTGLGRTATFTTGMAGGGAITFANPANTLAASGGSLRFTAGTSLTLSNLNSGGGDVFLTAGFDGAGDLSARNVLTANSGNITMTATNVAGGLIVQSGAAVGLAVNVTATDNLTVDSMRGTTIHLTSIDGRVQSAGANPIQASTQLTVGAATGISVNTLAASVSASNSTSGGIAIMQTADLAQPLAISGSGVINSAAGGKIDIINYGSTITVNPGAAVQSSSASVMLLALDLTLSGTVDSGTEVTILSGSVAGRPIDVGTDTPDTVGLTQAELDNVTAGRLMIGTMSSGLLTVSAPVTRTSSPLLLASGGNITEGIAGTVTAAELLVAAYGDVTMNEANDVDVLAGGVSGMISFGNGTNPLIIGTVAGTLGLNNVAGVTILADNLDIQQAVMSAGRVTLAPFTATTQIRPGGVDAPGVLGISDAELDKVTAAVVQIGNGSDTAGILVIGPVTLHAGFDTLALVTGGTINQAMPVSVPKLRIMAEGLVTLGLGTNDFGQVSGRTNGVADLIVADTNDLVVGTVDGTTGLTTANGSILVTTGGALTINEIVAAGGNNTVTLDSDGAATQGLAGSVAATNLVLLGAGPFTLTNPANTATVLAANTTGSIDVVIAALGPALAVGQVGATVGVATTDDAVTIRVEGGNLTVAQPINAGAAAVSLTAALADATILNVSSIAGNPVTLTADRMALAGGTINAGTGSVTLVSNAAGRAIDLGSATDAAAALELSDAELDTITAGRVIVGSAAAGTITVTDAIDAANTTFLSLRTGGEISDGYLGADLTETSLTLEAVSGIGVLNDLDVQVTNLEAKTDTGGIRLYSPGGVTVGGIDNALTGLQVVTSGDLRLETVGTITLSDTDGLQSVTGGSASGNVTLIAAGAASNVQSSVNRDAITATAGSITVTAGQDILFGTAGADFDNDVRANGSISFTAGRDVTVDGFSDVASDYFGQATGGGVTIVAGRDVNIVNTNGVDASISASGIAGGSVTVTTGAGGALNLSAQSSAALASSSGSVTVNADRVLIGATSGITASDPAASITIRPATAGRAMDLGSATDLAAAVELSDAEIDRLFTPTLHIGSATAGNINITAAVTVANTTLTLDTGGTIGQTGPLSAANLRFWAEGAVTLTNAGNDFDVIAGRVDSGPADAQITDADDLTVGAVDGLAYIATVFGNLTLTTGSALTVNVSANAGGGGTLTLNSNGPVTQGGAGDVLGSSMVLLGAGPFTLTNPGNLCGVLAAQTTGSIELVLRPAGPTVTIGQVGATVGVTTTDDAVTIRVEGGNLTVAQQINAGAAAVSLTASTADATITNNSVIAGNAVTLTADRMALAAGTINAGAGSVTLVGNAAGRAIDLGSATDAAAALELSDAELDTILAGRVIVGAATTGTITITDNISPLNTTWLALRSGGQIAESHGGADLTETNVTLEAVSGIGVADAIDLAITNLEAKTDTGGINLNSIGGLTVGGIDAALPGLQVVTSGDLILVAGGSITLSDTDGAQSVTGGSASGNVTLTANGAASNVQSSVDRDAITATRGSIEVNAGQDILLGTGGASFDNDVRASGSISFTAGRDVTVAGFADVSSDDFGQTTGGGMTIVAGRDVNVSSANGDDASVGVSGAGGGSVTLTTGAGGALNVSVTFGSAIFSNSGSVTVNADRVLIGSSSTITANNGSITIRPFSAGRAMDLGSATDAAAAVELSDAEIDRLFSPTLHIGAVTAGNITITAAITPANVTTLTLASGGAVVDGTAGEQVDITVEKLAIRAAAGIGAADDIDVAGLSPIQVAALSAGGDIQISSGEAMDVTTVDGLVGVNSSGGNITLSNVNVMYLNAAVSSEPGVGGILSESGAILHNVAPVLGLGNITLNAGPSQAPVVANPIVDQTIDEDAPYSLTFAADTFSDADPGDTLAYSATLADDSKLPAWLSFDGATRTFSGTPDDPDVGTISVKVTATDLFGATGSDTFDLTIVNVNETPVLANPIIDQTINEEALYNFTFPANTFSDPDLGDTLAYSASLADDSKLPAWLSFDGTTRTFSGTPDDADIGTISVKVTATDLLGLTATDTFDLTIQNVDEAPTVANPISDQKATEELPFTLTFAADTFADEDIGDTIAYTATKGDNSKLPAWLSFNPATRTFSGTPDDPDLGVLTVKVTGTDGKGLSASDTFTIAVTGVNDDPVAVDDKATTGPSTPVLINVLGNDTDVDAGDILSIASVATPANGTTSIVAGKVRYLPDFGFHGTETFAYQISDGHGGLATGQVTVTIGAGVGVGIDGNKRSLEVVGTGAGDTIDIQSAGAGRARVILNGVNTGTFAFGGRIVVFGQGGNDTITVDQSITRPAALFGEGGNDLLSGGGGHDVLRGGEGNDVAVGGRGDDVLFGDAGRDILIGSFGTDRLFGGAGDDVLIGGYTTLDGNVAALNALRRQWSRTDIDYAERATILRRGLGHGVKLDRLNVLSSPTAPDQMTGGEDQDLFYANPALRQGKRDTVLDDGDDETVVAVRG